MIKKCEKLKKKPNQKNKQMSVVSKIWGEELNIYWQSQKYIYESDIIGIDCQ